MIDKNKDDLKPYSLRLGLFKIIGKTIKTKTKQLTEIKN
jgi:hypothetical protein